MTTPRLNRLAYILQSAGLDALVLNPGPSLTYLTGLQFHLMERPTMAFFAPSGAITLVMAELEALKAQGLPFSPQVFKYNDDPSTWVGVYEQAVKAAGLDGKTIGLEPSRLRVLELRLFESTAPHARFISAQDSLSALRMQKDASEVAAMRHAVKIAQKGLQAILPIVKPGVTERELASELVLQILRAGSDPEFPFNPIVASGANSANPHAVPTDRKLVSGDMLVFDWGAAVDGYFSDLTRTYAVGSLEKEMSAIANLVLNANAAGRAAAKPGTAAGAVDQAARAEIERGGYGAYFTHRTGHGIGMEAHEEPYIFGANKMVLAEGMTFTVEPGIYLPGRGGVRIEDNLVITADGAESLSDMPRQVTVLG